MNVVVVPPAPDKVKELPEFRIKCRLKGTKAWYFVAPNGKMNRLRIHALQYRPSVVADAVQGYAKENPSYEFKAVKIA